MDDVRRILGYSGVILAQFIVIAWYIVVIVVLPH
ncbi:hypothetical protein SAMN05421788_101348 [Filimonas lacunae]|uniref:Uncharacterized protein n=1 Tax=Filimonas lacunae TaxID=477680 RepID=A0A1N7KQ24_9BACT|nr:hypothetical protein SAMN05421788_101348 [Filimonas lacunae]